MLKTDTNWAGLSIEVFDGIRASVFMHRSQFSKDLTVPFCGAHRSEVCSMRGAFRL